MNRKESLHQLEQKKEWDIIIIGGGATGLGTAVDAATRGYQTLLLEQADFAKGTSSRATKLVHGGVRYLAQGNIKLVREALKERGLLLKNAPHLSRNLSFVLPCYGVFQKIYYGIGLKLYDILAGRLGLGNTRIIGKQSTVKDISNIQTGKLSGAVIYQDGQFDDARLAINLAQTAAENGAVVLNYCRVTQLIKTAAGKINGVVVTDSLSGKTYSLQSQVVINATGVFADEVMQMDDPAASKRVSPSQGIHLVVDKTFFPASKAMMIPKTNDGRVLFAVPWHDKVVLGTTDTPIESHSLEPVPLEEEINFILEHINHYLTTTITRKDVRSVFAGLRPLVKKDGTEKTALMPRDHTIITSKNGLVTITGGKWTTYRKMASDVLNKAVEVAGINQRTCVTEILKIHGWVADANFTDPLHWYGSDAAAIQQLAESNPLLKEKIHPDLPYIRAEVVWAVQQEMAMTVEDVLARRTRMLFLDAKAAIASAPLVASLMAPLLEKNESWINEQVTSFVQLAQQYVLT